MTARGIRVLFMSQVQLDFLNSFGSTIPTSEAAIRFQNDPRSGLFKSSWRVSSGLAETLLVAPEGGEGNRHELFPTSPPEFDPHLPASRSGGRSRAGVR
jgi:hypothetical protein